MTQEKCKQTAVMAAWSRLMPFALWLGALLTIAIALLVFEADLLWKVQQHNLFLGSVLFFKQQMAVPAGMLSWLGAFFTQHFYYPWVGVILICGLWLLLMWLTRRAFCIPGRWIVVTLIPVAILLLANMSLGYWLYVIKLRGWFFVPTIGTIAATALVWAFRKTALPAPQTQRPRALWLQAAFIVLSALIGYPLAGVYALAAVIVMGIMAARRKWLFSVVALLSVLSVPLLYYRFVYCHTNLKDIYTVGIPVFAMNDHYPLYLIPYCALALCFLLCSIPTAVTFRAQPQAPRPSRVPLIISGCMLAALVGCVCRFWYKDANFHHELRMQRCVENADWQGVIQEGERQVGEPTRAIVMMHNLALARLGRQCSEMYRFPKGSKKPDTPLPVYMYHVAGRMMLYQYGLLNECHHVCMEEGVEYGWSMELLQYLARCAILNHETRAAGKFLDILRLSCYGGAWADDMDRLLNDPALLTKDRETGPVTHMLHYQDRLGSAEGYVERYVMTNLAQYDADDLYFQEQAVLAALWTRDSSLFWPRFEHYVQLKGETDIPRIFQEAAWLFANIERQEGLDEWSLEEGVQESLFSFMKLMQQYKRSPNAWLKAQLYDLYGTTYYFEYFFLKDITYY